MNSEISVEVDHMEHLPAKTMLRLLEKKQAAQKHALLYAHTVKVLAPMFLEFEAIDIDVMFSFRDGDIDISFAGDGERLRQVWALLRRSGYVPNCHPKKGDTSHYCFWEQEGVSRFWMSFTSTLCKRVQVGTEMKEVPIYQTQCGELPDLQLEEIPRVIPAPMAELESDIPF